MEARVLGEMKSPAIVTKEARDRPLIFESRISLPKRPKFSTK
jgi:hypothetical protein